jgi:thiol-disulfide isomerase/thioredoxin
MLLRGCLLGLALFSVEPSLAAERIWSLQGRVVDQEGHPVAGASVATFWGGNGVTLEQLRKVEQDGKDHPELAMNEGRLEPWGQATPSQTDANGDFSIQLKSSNEWKLMAVDKERKRGGLIIVDPRHPPSRVECRLVPLIRVHGRVRVAATGKPITPWDRVYVGLPFNEDFPLGRLRLEDCASVKSRFEFWLPPGDYRLEAFGPDLELTKPHPIRVTAGQHEVDCGVLDLSPILGAYIWRRVEETKKSGSWRPYTQRYGQPCPKWHVIDARGMPKDAQPSDLRGKWLVVYFWSPGCGPCLETTLPQLCKFYEAHQTQRERFELVSICMVDPSTRTMADLDRMLKPIVKVIWGGKELPFPVLLDNTTKSMESFGVELFGVTVLIDPTGRLVQGDESTLAAILKKGRENGSSGRP